MTSEPTRKTAPVVPANRTALITGVAGQDGMFLARHLRSQGVRVVGTVRPGVSSHARMAPYLDGVEVVDHDVCDAEGFGDLLKSCDPYAVFNLAAFSAVRQSWEEPGLVLRSNLLAVEQMMETLLEHRAKNSRDVRFFQASTAEVFGNDVKGPLDEDTPHRPRTPYATSKSAAHHLVVSYREHHGLFACNGILFNHESPFRGQRFIAGRIVRTAASVALGRPASIQLGDLGIYRDWGAAEDYVRAMQIMVDHDEPNDYVLATGRVHTLHDMLTVAFEAAGVGSYEDHVELSPHLWSATQAERLQGDPWRAARTLGWEATTSFAELVSAMVRVDLERLRTGVAESPDYLHV